MATSRSCGVLFLLVWAVSGVVSCGVGPAEPPHPTASPVDSAPVDPDAIAVVNGRTIRRAELESAVAFFRMARPEEPDEGRWVAVVRKLSEADSKLKDGDEGWHYPREFRSSALGKAIFENPRGTVPPRSTR